MQRDKLARGRHKTAAVIICKLFDKYMFLKTGIFFKLDIRHRS